MGEQDVVPVEHPAEPPHQRPEAGLQAGEDGLDQVKQLADAGDDGIPHVGDACDHHGDRRVDDVTDRLDDHIGD